MAILALGVSYRRAPIELLERLAFGEDDYAKAYRRVDDSDALRHIVVLSTCNRIELYADVASYHAGFLALKRLLAESRDVGLDDLADPLYSHFEDQAVEHLFTVTSGLDSMVVGEQQIQSQVRAALKRAEAERTVGPALTRAFHAAIRTARRVRAETALGAAPDAFVEAGCELAESHIGDLRHATAIVLGAGQMSALAVKHLRRRSVESITILNRSLERARVLGERVGASHGDLTALRERLADADLVVSATGAAGTIVSEVVVRSSIERRDDRPLAIVDLAVPRDVEPSIATIPNVSLVDLEALRAVLDRSREGASHDIDRARGIVAEELERFRRRGRSEQLAPLITALRRRGELVAASEVERFGSRLVALSPDERGAVDELARAIVSKVLHDPIVQLKDRASDRADDAYVRALTELFGLENDPRTPPG
jgi:glutamyl-tRNA reductase